MEVKFNLQLSEFVCWCDRKMVHAFGVISKARGEFGVFINK